MLTDKNEKAQQTSQPTLLEDTEQPTKRHDSEMCEGAADPNTTCKPPEYLPIKDNPNISMCKKWDMY